MTTIIGMDNALMDILVTIDDSTLKELGLEKGVVHFPPEEVLNEVKKLKTNTVSPGGCGANTMSLLSQLGVDTMFIGKVGDDFHGDSFEDELKLDAVKSGIVRAKGDTGVAICLITPDGQRTFADNLGVGNTLTPEELPAFSGKILYISNFYLTDPSCRPAVEATIHAMKQLKGKVALDLSDPNVVEANLKYLKKSIKKDIDIVFANELEAKALTGKDTEDACREISELCEIAVVKLGKNGSLIRGGDNLIHVQAHPVEVLDTTGAGDSYAAGFLYGYVNDWSLEKSGELGSLVASKIIQQVGARLKKMPEDIKLFIAE